MQLSSDDVALLVKMRTQEAELEDPDPDRFALLTKLIRRHRVPESHASNVSMLDDLRSVMERVLVERFPGLIPEDKQDEFLSAIRRDRARRAEGCHPRANGSATG